MAFILHLPISLFVYHLLSTWTCGYLVKSPQETRGYILKEHEDVFLKRQNLFFSLAAESISFVFCFRLNIFTGKI